MPHICRAQPSPPCPLLSQLLSKRLDLLDAAPASIAGRQRVPPVPGMPGSASHLPGQGAHSRLRGQRCRASRRAPSTRSTLSLVELQPMRPMRRTWRRRASVCASAGRGGGHTARCEGLCAAPSLVFNTPFPIKSCHRANYAN